MVGYWGYPNGNIPASAMVLVEDCYFEPDTAARVIWAVNEVRRRGGRVGITEGYRPLGVPADFYVLSPSRTSTGGSNQWFQKGREARGLTPSAATPGTSSHGYGQAGDFSYSDWPLMVSVFRQVGLLFTISSERWHADSSGPNFMPAGFTPIPVGLVRIIEENTMETIYYQHGELNEWGIFGPLVDGGFRTTTDVLVAQAWGKLYGTHGLNASGIPVKNGAPWEALSDENWDNLKVVSAQGRTDYLAAHVSTGDVTVTVGELSDATIQKLAAANAEAFFTAQKLPGN